VQEEFVSSSKLRRSSAGVGAERRLNLSPKAQEVLHPKNAGDTKVAGLGGRRKNKGRYLRYIENIPSQEEIASLGGRSTTTVRSTGDMRYGPLNFTSIHTEEHVRRKQV